MASSGARCPVCARTWPAGTLVCPFDDVSLLSTGSSTSTRGGPGAAPAPGPEDRALPPGEAGATETPTLALPPGPPRFPAAALRDPDAGIVIAGKYEIERKLGEGAFGTTYLCRDLRFHRGAVVKVLKARLAADPDMVRRFNLEALALSRLRHPAIVQVYDRDVAPDGSPWFAMELAEGVLLTKRIREGSIPETEACLYAAHLCDALAAVHAAGVIHRDVKPDNLVLGRDSAGSPLLRLLDFGAACIAGEKETVDTALWQERSQIEGVRIGTPGYMSPEQARGEILSGATDVFAAGAVLFHMLAGEIPTARWSGWSASSIERYATEPPKKLEGLRPDVSAAVAAIVYRALQKDPRRRFADAGEMRDALRAALAAPRHPATRRGPLVVALAAAVIAIAGVAFAVSMQRTAPVPPVVEPAPAPQPRLAVAPVPPPPAAPQVQPVPAVAEERPALKVAKAPAPKAADAPAPKPAESVARANIPERLEKMVAIPAGEAVVGCEAEECSDDERPQRKVRLAAFRVDRFEVTVGDYQACVVDGACSAPAAKQGCAPSRPGDRHPVNCVSWTQASEYCAWRKARLPTEFEWERAARGRTGRPFPWGAEPPNCERAALRDEGDGTLCGNSGPVVVGAHLAGATPEGIHDLAGNVQEWTADWYDANSSSPAPRRWPAATG